MEKIKSILKQIAPSLAAALGGPFSGVAMKFIADKLTDGTSQDESSFQELLPELLNKPENLQKIKDLDKQFDLEMRKLDINIMEMEVKDREAARSYSKENNKPQIYISILFLLAYFSMLAAIFAVEASDSLNMEKGQNSLMGELQILFGVLTAGVGQILSFWFGGGLRKSNITKD